MRIVVTGASGKAGRYVAPYLVSQGHSVLNLDLIPFPEEHQTTPPIYTIRTDMTESGQVFNALTSLFSPNEYSHEPPWPGKPDAVIHLAAYARNMIVPDNETFRANMASTYNVIEAACKLGIRKVVTASSETVYGVCCTQGDSDYHSFPLEEDYDADPMDSYAISKLCGERVARGFARRFGVDIYALRIGNVIVPEDYQGKFKTFITDPSSRKRNAWSYIDARDLGQICDLCIKKDGLGFQVFNATNDTITTNVPTKEFLAKEFPGVKVTREMGEWEAPLSNRKIREVLGFKDVHDWRKYVGKELPQKA